jgi:hypothetical protein
MGPAREGHAGNAANAPANAIVSFLKETLVYALSCALSRVWMPAPSPRNVAIVAPSASSTVTVSR